MGRTRVWFLTLVALLSLVLAGCGTLQIGDVIIAYIDGESYGGSLGYDFGMVDPDVGSDVTIEFTNLSDQEVFIIDVDTGSSVFPVDGAEDDVLVASGESLSVIIGFLPTNSQSYNGEVVVMVEGFSESFRLDLSGEGNHMPEIVEIVTVTGAGTSAVNGTYYRDGTANEISGIPIPTFTHAGGAYFIEGRSVEGVWWEITDGESDYYDFDYARISVPTFTWDLGGSGTGNAPSVTGSYGLNSVSGVSIGDVLDAQYEYSDAEGDLEAGTTFAWYTSATADGTYTFLTTTTTSEYTVQNGEEDLFFQVRVTPFAATGNLTGEEVVFGPHSPDSYGLF